MIVQWVGAWSYNDLGWNSPPEKYGVLVEALVWQAPFEACGSAEGEIALARPGARVIGRLSGNIDLPRNRGRLWSLTDSQILYFLTHYSAGHEERNGCAKTG